MTATGPDAGGGAGAGVGAGVGAGLGLAGRHLLITGAGGLGRVLAADALDLGMTVTVADRDPAALAALPASAQLRTVEVDLANVAGLPALVSSAVEWAGPIDAFVPTAAVVRRQHDMREITEVDWELQVTVNQKAVYFHTRRRRAYEIQREWLDRAGQLGGRCHRRPDAPPRTVPQRPTWGLVLAEDLNRGRLTHGLLEPAFGRVLDERDHLRPAHERLLDAAHDQLPAGFEADLVAGLDLAGDTFVPLFGHARQFPTWPQVAPPRPPPATPPPADPGHQGRPRPPGDPGDPRAGPDRGMSAGATVILGIGNRRADNHQRRGRISGPAARRLHLRRRRRGRRLPGRPGGHPPLLLAVPAGGARQHPRLRRGRPQPAQRRARRPRRHTNDCSGNSSATGLGQILDIVPNHMALAGRANAWWWDVLENGPSSRYATYFDIDWDPPQRKLAATVLMPILGDHYGRVLDAGELRDRVPAAASSPSATTSHAAPLSPRTLDGLLGGAAARAGRHRSWPPWPRPREPPPRAAHGSDPPWTSATATRRRCSAGWPSCTATTTVRGGRGRRRRGRAAVNDDPDALDALLQRQNYRLAYWRTASEELSYRRFFNIETLAGLRVEDQRVFADTHRLILELVAEGAVDGLRIDHVDGLADPEGYLDRLRDAHGRLLRRRGEDPGGRRATARLVAGGGHHRLRLPQPGQPAVRRRRQPAGVAGGLRQTYRRGSGLRRRGSGGQARRVARRAGRRAGTARPPCSPTCARATVTIATTPAGSCGPP